MRRPIVLQCVVALSFLTTCGREDRVKLECSNTAEVRRTHAECNQHPLPESEGLWTCVESRCVWKEIPLTAIGVTPIDERLCLSAEAAEIIGGHERVKLDLDAGNVTVTFSKEEVISGAAFRDTTVQCRNGEKTEPPPATRAPETPLTGAQCGPDMTTRTFDVMQQIIDDFQAAADRQAAACSNLISFSTAEHAWDIYPYYPGPVCPDDIGNIARTSGCGRPCHPCASGVVFLDRCINYQVLNYVFWGVSSELCGQQILQRFLSTMRSLNSVHRNAQGSATAMGRLYASGVTRGVPRDHVRQSVQNLFERARPVWAALPEDGCSRTCTYTWSAPLTYRWSGLTN